VEEEEQDQEEEENGGGDDDDDVMMTTDGIKGEIRLAPLAGCYEHEPSGSIKYEECPYQTSGH
jgi:hypothetical protein